MAQHHLLSLDGDTAQLCLAPKGEALPPARFIMIPPHYMDFPGGKLIEESFEVVAAPREIPKEVEKIPGLQDFLEVLQDLEVHRFVGSEGTLAVADDVAVPKVEICGEEDTHVSFAFAWSISARDA
jgi:hypothetical protein